MTETPPRSWPAADGEHGGSIEEEDSRPSTMETYSTPHERESFEKAEEVKRSKNTKGNNLDKLDMPQFAMPELPPEIRETILYLTDPETFASLVLVDHAWREVSQTPNLYAHHLSRCPSYSRTHSVIGGPFTDASLPLLKQQFAREVKRNLFEAYLQPRRTFVSLKSTTTSSSAAFPGGEAFDFSFSPNGHWVLALSSSRIYVIDTVSPEVSVQRELKVLRRPVSAAILDDGSTLAVLSSDQEVNVYSLTNFKVNHLRSITLDSPPHAIALAPKGEVLAVALKGGIEVHSLAPNASDMDHRGIKCDRVDSLRFSSDGTMLVGTTKNCKSPNTVILSAPYYTDDHQELPASDQISHLWTSQILFPNSSRDCSNATLLPNRSDGDANWTFTYDKVFESFRAVRTDDLRNGTTYFTGPKHPGRDGPRSSRKKLTPCTLPASSERGELVAAGFLGKDIWIYGVPEGLDTSTVSHTDEMAPHSGSSTEQNTPANSLRSPRRSFTRGEAAELTRLPKWQVLVDRYRNVFAKGRQVAEISGVTSVCWVIPPHKPQGTHSLAERLVIAAPGGIAGDPELEQDDFASVDGGRLLILDFDRMNHDGCTEEVVFEVGNDEPELLEEESRDMDTEVAIARRRTVRRELAPGASVADILASAPPLPSLAPTANAIANRNSPVTRDLAPTVTTAPDIHLPPNDTESPGEGLSLEEASEVFGGSYSHTQPRSRSSLYRSATAVAANRQRNPNAPRIVEQGEVRYRRPGDRTELPHESDADNWVPPPPAYTAKPDRPLPEELRMTLAPRNSEQTRRARFTRDRPRRASTVYESPPSGSGGQRIGSLPERPSMPPRQRSAEASATSHQAHRSFSDTLSQRSGAVSPLSTAGFLFGDEISEPSTSRQPSSASSSRRPMSAFVGSLASSLRRPSSSRLASTAPNQPIPPMPQRQRMGNTTSLPPSPTRNERPSSPITLTGANLQQRLEYPLPPAPNNSSMESLHRRFAPASQGPPAAQRQNPRSEPSAYEEMNAIAAGMPSAQQLADLNHRSRQAPPPQSSRCLPTSISSLSSYPIPAPPRGALGAAGNRSSTGPLQSPTRSLSNRNSFARSTPTLLRPTAQRLDTIDSVNSFISRSRTRSMSRDLHTVGSDPYNRSNVVGPALRLDRVTTDGQQQKRSLFGGRRPKKGKGKGGENRDNIIGNNDISDGKGGKCIIM